MSWASWAINGKHYISFVFFHHSGCFKQCSQPLPWAWPACQVESQPGKNLSYKFPIPALADQNSYLFVSVQIAKRKYLPMENSKDHRMLFAQLQNLGIIDSWIIERTGPQPHEQSQAWINVFVVQIKFHFFIILPWLCMVPFLRIEANEKVMPKPESIDIIYGYLEKLLILPIWPRYINEHIFKSCAYKLFPSIWR